MFIILEVLSAEKSPVAVVRSLVVEEVPVSGSESGAGAGVSETTSDSELLEKLLIVVSLGVVSLVIVSLVVASLAIASLIVGSLAVDSLAEELSIEGIAIVAGDDKSVPETGLAMPDSVDVDGESDTPDVSELPVSILDVTSFDVVLLSVVISPLLFVIAGSPVSRKLDVAVALSVELVRSVTLKSIWKLCLKSYMSGLKLSQVVWLLQMSLVTS